METDRYATGRSLMGADGAWRLEELLAVEESRWIKYSVHLNEDLDSFLALFRVSMIFRPI